MNIGQDKVVSIHYTLTNGSGEVLDSSSGGEPLAYLHGKGNIIPGLEKALEGRKTGEKLDNGEFNIRRLSIRDKHGLTRTAYNAKINIYREAAQPILLGIQDKKLPASTPA